MLVKETPTPMKFKKLNISSEYWLVAPSPLRYPNKGITIEIPNPSKTLEKQITIIKSIIL